MLLCDRVWLMEAVSNIVKNAFDHTAVDGRISISGTQLPSVVKIVIRDNGSGIHPEDIYHIFKRFYRSLFSKDTQGIGLGLPLAIGIALNKLLFTKLISFHWGDAWILPVGELGVILAVIVFSLFISVRGPVKRISRMSIVDTINDQ